MTMGLSRVSSVNSSRAVDGDLKGPDLALIGPHGPLGAPGFAGGHHAEPIWLQPEVLGFGQHFFSFSRRCSFSLASRLRSRSRGGVTRDLR
jgi:hypothetical protein